MSVFLTIDPEIYFEFYFDIAGFVHDLENSTGPVAFGCFDLDFADDLATEIYFDVVGHVSAIVSEIDLVYLGCRRL